MKTFKKAPWDFEQLPYLATVDLKSKVGDACNGSWELPVTKLIVKYAVT